MSDKYDRFQININETYGKITRQSFVFRYDKFEVLKEDSLIVKDTTPSRIRGVLINKNLNINIIGNETNKYLEKSLVFDTISSDIESIRWNNQKFIENYPDYMALFYINGVLAKITFVIHKTSLQINFFANKHEDLLKPLSDICLSARNANKIYSKGNIVEAKPILIEVYHYIKKNPGELRFINDYGSIGRSFLLMLDLKLTDDIDILQFIVSIGYLCISLAIEDTNENKVLYMDRIILLNFGHTPFSYTVMQALDLNSGFPFSISSRFADMEARDAIYKMEIIDFENNPSICQKDDFFQDRKSTLEEMIENDFFLPEKTRPNILSTGANNHRKVLSYLENKVIVNEDVDFE